MFILAYSFLFQSGANAACVCDILLLGKFVICDAVNTSVVKSAGVGGTAGSLDAGCRRAVAPAVALFGTIVADCVHAVALAFRAV